MLSSFSKRMWSALLLLPAVAFADWREDIGLRRLLDLLGPDAPEGHGIRVTQVEARDAGGFLADTAEPDLEGLSVLSLSPNPVVSPHATEVARFLAGRVFGVAPGVEHLDAWESVDWLARGALREDAQFQGAPLPESSDIQIHSWVADRARSIPVEVAIKVTRLLDYSVWRDGFLAVTSTRNDPASPLPDLLTHSYNGISVGVASGRHSGGLTYWDLPGRTKPEVVVPVDHTSYAVPIVAGAAALLMEEARSRPELAGGDAALVIKALLLAGADRSTLPDWKRNPSRPLDAHWGAGLLRVDHAWEILDHGRFPSGPIQPMNDGWDQATLPDGQREVYRWATGDEPLSEFSVALCWWREITDSDPGPAFVAEARVSNFNLRLFQRGEQGYRLVQASRSAVDNVELIHIRDLPPGEYMLEVSSDLGGPYALAWRRGEAL